MTTILVQWHGQSTKERKKEKEYYSLNTFFDIFVQGDDGRITQISHQMSQRTWIQQETVANLWSRPIHCLIINWASSISSRIGFWQLPHSNRWQHSYYVTGYLKCSTCWSNTNKTTDSLLSFTTGVCAATIIKMHQATQEFRIALTTQMVWRTGEYEWHF